jgi:hypothetical protein
MYVKKLWEQRRAERLNAELALASIPAQPSKGDMMSVSSLRNGKMIVKVSEVKDVVGGGYRISEEFYYELDREVHEMIDEAARRAKKNGRRTLKPYDL